MDESGVKSPQRVGPAKGAESTTAESPIPSSPGMLNTGLTGIPGMCFVD